jgi:hypothetical protein
MTTKKIPLADAGASDLATFAGVNLGLDVQSGASAAKLRAAIAQAGYTKDFIEIEADEPSAPTQRFAMLEPTSINDAKMVTVLIQSQPGPGGDQPVPLGCNGSHIWVERGKPQTIKAKFFESLKHAVVWQYDPDDKQGVKTKPREVPQYPYSILGMS